MPFVSTSQRRKFYSMMRAGDISKDTVKEWERETGDRKLPKRVRAKRPKYKKRKE